MNQIQVRKIVRGVRNAADFALLQLHYSAIHVNEKLRSSQVNGLTDDSLRFALHALRDNCDFFMQDDPQSLTRIGQSVAVLASARSALLQELIWQRDDNESMRFRARHGCRRRRSIALEPAPGSIFKQGKDMCLPS
jgi:hypothetical protein